MEYFLSKIGEYTIEPVGRQVGYMIHCKTNLGKLEAIAETLKAARESLATEVDAAKTRGETIRPDVELWLEKVNLITAETDEWLKDESQAKLKCLHGFCPNLIIRRHLSRDSTKLVPEIVQLYEKRGFSSVSYGPHQKEVSGVTRNDYVALPSRISVVKKIMDELKTSETNRIEVCGMGGVGKTTLVKEVYKQAAEDKKLFDDVIILLDVKQNPDLEAIQKKIVEKLGMEVLDNETMHGRASRLCARIQGKMILVILDDVEEKLDLKLVGLPSLPTCKILLTCRTRGVLGFHNMRADKRFHLDVLVKEEAWSLFEKMAGDVVKQNGCRDIAIQIAERCGGLPLLVVTVASALKDESRLHVWKDALRRLRRFDREEITEKVYLAVEWCYNNLDDEELKPLFLLCGIVVRDNHFCSSDLLKYCMGLGLLKNVDTVEEARHTLDILVEKLKDSCLLLERDVDGLVKMHDLVCHVAFRIAYRDHHVLSVTYGDDLKDWPEKEIYKRCTMILLNSSSIPILSLIPWECPDLKMFHLVGDAISMNSVEIPSVVFREMKKLRVLNLINLHILSLPPSLQFLKNLHMLCLDKSILGDVALVGELSNLEILSFCKSRVKQLPKEIGQLTRLRLLDLSDCSELEVIVPGVISSLVTLEELRMRNSFNKWEVEGERSNASLSELKHLSRLSSLDIHIPNADILPANLFSQKLKLNRFNIIIGVAYVREKRVAKTTLNTLKLKLTTSLEQLDEGLRLLVKRSEDLSLYVEGVNTTVHPLDTEGLEHHLQLQSDVDLTHIINSKVVFPNLTFLSVHGCDGLRFMFSFSTAARLVQLKQLVISGCEFIEEIISTREGEENMDIMFPNLEDLILVGLPKVVRFCTGSYIEFPSLKNLEIVRCSKLEAFIVDNKIWKEIEEWDPEQNLDVKSETGVQYFFFDGKARFPGLERLKINQASKLKTIWHTQLAQDSFCRLRQVEVSECVSLINVLPPSIVGRLNALEVVFPNLTILSVHGCDGLRFMFSFSMATRLVQLKQLVISGCEFIEEIISTREGEENMDNMFPNLEDLILVGLPKVVRFCTGSYIEFPSLKNLEIVQCSKLEAFIVDNKISKEIEEWDPEENFDVKSETGVQYFLFDGKARFPSLERLKINQASKLRTIWHTQLAQDSFCSLKQVEVSECVSLINVLHPSIVGRLNALEVVFPNLTILSVHGCDGLRFMFSFSMATRLVQLKQLVISGCEFIEEIISTREGEENMDNMFPNLEDLILVGLPKVVRFCTGSYIEFPSLKNLEIVQCSKLEAFIVDNKISKEIEEWDPEENFDVKSETGVQYFLFDGKARFPSLERLKINQASKLRTIWHTQLAQASFSRLRQVEVSECVSLINVLPPSIVGGLNALEVRSCERIVLIVASNIVGDDDPDDVSENEFDFSSLKCLTLADLPSLQGFCSVHCIVKFSSAITLKVELCPIELKISPNGFLLNELTELRLAELRLAELQLAETRIQTLKKIMDELKNPNTIRIGVCGIAGVGKTTLAKAVHKQATEDKELFDDVVILLDVKSNTDLEGIQKKIVEKLGMDILDNDTIDGRASRLSARIKDKKVLVILDDVCEQIDLVAVGLPSVAACKILLTSRFRKTLSDMSTQKEFLLDILQEKESWVLFEKKALDVVKDPAILEVAKQVAKNCGGLPILVVTVASVLKQRTTLPPWTDALTCLQEGSDREEELAEKAHLGLEWSYKQLNDKELKQIFLLCGITIRGNSISLADLLRYSMGLGFLKKAFTVEEARKALLSRIEKLKDYCLLIESDDNRYVRMHELVLNVANQIAFRDRHILSLVEDGGNRELKELSDKYFLEKCTIMSFPCGNNIPRLPEVMHCPTLTMFHLQGDLDDDSQKISPRFFEKMKNLQVLSLRCMTIPTLPLSLQFLKNLVFLCLDQCILGDVALIGELSNLEILSFSESNVKQLPTAVGQLTHLRLLDLSDCSELEVISPGVISSLGRLEELRMRNSFKKWEVEGEGSNASLSELKHLSQLSFLEIHIPNADILPANLFSPELERFNIIVGDVCEKLMVETTLNSLKLKLTTSIEHLDEGLKFLVERSEDLSLYTESVNNIFHPLDTEEFEHLKHLQLESNVVDFTHIINIKAVFPNLTSLTVHRCGRLSFLFSISMAKSLVGLKHLEISTCAIIEEIVSSTGEHGQQNMDNMFPKLEDLKLNELPTLTRFCSGSYIQLLSLEKLDIEGCSKLGAFISDNVAMSGEDIRICKEIEEKDSEENLDVNSKLNTAQCFLFDEKIGLPNLTSLMVHRCDGLNFLLLSSMARSLVKLKHLVISECQRMEAVLTKEHSEENKDNMFPELKELDLKDLPHLVRFCSGNYFEFASMERLQLEKCAKLETFICNPSSTSIASQKEMERVDKNENLETEVPYFLFDKKVGLPRLERLIINELPKLTTIWHTQLAPNSFRRLRDVTVQRCNGLKYIFQVSIIAGVFHQLQKLIVKECGVEEIVSQEEGIEKLMPDQFFPKLTCLEFTSLFQLERFYLKMPAINWPLKTLVLSDCQKVDIFAAESSGRQKIHDLGNLRVKQYYVLFEKSLFPKLEDLTFSPVDIWYGRPAHEKALFPATGTDGSLPHLRTLRLHGMEKFMRLWENTEPAAGSAFPQLKTLEVKFSGLTNLELSAISFRNLTTIEVTFCWRLQYLTTYSVAQSLVQLKTLKVDECKNMKEIFTSEGMGEGASKCEIVFRQLQTLELGDLISLERFCASNCRVKVPILGTLKVNWCPFKLKISSDKVLEVDLESDTESWSQSMSMHEQDNRRLRAKEGNSLPETPVVLALPETGTSSSLTAKKTADLPAEVIAQLNALLGIDLAAPSAYQQLSALLPFLQSTRKEWVVDQIREALQKLAPAVDKKSSELTAQLEAGRSEVIAGSSHIEAECQEVMGREAEPRFASGPG
ncbi:uncharacterized protein LOC112188155 isoform X2 [Rosa chinensis]|uniref:uncharacterized protein LOC112188155 isoform X2 n=1 Tax=Rosa chinensis TaxID=74649 RepID=UPI000D095F3E|nr:uncharacterized protein LOC112188155 isoform X2 [Rosa chinensis]